ncbi:hypothetical protein FHS85_003180 [Rhodoligotrophos appendicifer]
MLPKAACIPSAQICFWVRDRFVPAVLQACHAAQPNWPKKETADGLKARGTKAVSPLNRPACELLPLG